MKGTKGKRKMKKYTLNESSRICSNEGEIILKKGTEVLSNGCLDEYGGIDVIVNSGIHKGMEIILEISELDEVI